MWVQPLPAVSALLLTLLLQEIMAAINRLCQRTSSADSGVRASGASMLVGHLNRVHPVRMRPSLAGAFSGAPLVLTHSCCRRVRFKKKLRTDKMGQANAAVPYCSALNRRANALFKPMMNKKSD